MAKKLGGVACVQGTFEIPKSKQMRIFFTFILCLHTFILAAQWSSNPENPALIVNANGEQKNLQILPDSLGGIFVFWRDNRTLSTQFEIYGQHYNSDGIAQWETNGRLLIGEATSIEIFQALSLPNGEFSLAWQFNAPAGNPSTDGKIKCQRFNANGEGVWAAPVVMAEMATSGASSLWIVREFFAWTYQNRMYFGWFGEAFGVNIHRFTRVDFDGNLLSTLGGYTVSPFIYAGAKLIPDGFGGVYFHSYSSNSSFYGIGSQRFDSVGTAYGTQGLQELVPVTSMSSSYTAVADTGGITAFYPGENDLQAKRLTANGTPDWNGASRMICNAEGLQVDPQVIRKENGEYIIVWVDSRPGPVGQFAVYAQKLDAQMNPLWASNGVLLSNQATASYFDMNIQLVTDGSGIYTVIQKAGSTVWATRFNEEGNLIDTSGDLLVSTSPAPAPLNGDFGALMLGSHSVAAWSDGQDARIVCFQGCAQTFISNALSVCEPYTFNGITYSETGIYTIELPGDTILELDLTVQNFEAEINLNDFTLSAPENYASYQWISCATNEAVANGNSTFTPEENGEYALVASLNGCMDTTDCISVSGLGFQSARKIPVRIFPNPAISVLNIEFPNGIVAPMMIEVYDASGRLLLSEKHEAKKTLALNIDSFKPGLYAIRVSGQTFTRTLHWIKH